MWIQTLETQARKLSKRFNKIILTAYIGLVFIAGLLFWVEYKGVYKGYLTNLDLHFKMESKILDYGLEDKDHTLETVPIINAEFCTSCIINDKDMVVKHSHKPITKNTPLSSVLPKNLKDSYQDVLLKGPDKKRFNANGNWAYKSSIKNTKFTFITLVDKEALEKQAFVESVDTLISIIGAMTILLILVHFLIRREFIRPAQSLVSHLERESKGVSEPPLTHEEWQPWIDSITNVFSENRRLIGDLEDHIKNLDQKVLGRTREIQTKNKELEKAFTELSQAQDQIILQEKMASLGSLTAGIAHEMKNPLNFVINFSEVSQELMSDFLDILKPAIDRAPKDIRAEIDELSSDLTENMEHIREHGQRADHIIRSMLLHAHGGAVEKQPIDINTLLSENVDLAISGFKGNHRRFHVKIKTQPDPSHPKIRVVERDIGRVFLNMINNACYAVWEKKEKGDTPYDPKLTLSTRDLDQTIEIRIRDNGKGMPEDVRRKIFEPFFTTKPTGQGTGLGLSMCYEIIVKHHGGSIDIQSEPGKYTEFIINLPKE